MSRRPNLLFVFADQMRAMKIGGPPPPGPHTPVLDRLAAEADLRTGLDEPLDRTLEDAGDAFRPRDARKRALGLVDLWNARELLRHGEFSRLVL